MEMESQLSSSSPLSDPNHNSNGESAAESALRPDILTDHELRVPYYCEENVWRLAYRKVGPGLDCMEDDVSSSFWVVFISNQVKSVPMFQQRASSNPNTACCWDYHVILIGLDQGIPYVWDIDTLIQPYPCPLSTYLAGTFPYYDTTSSSSSPPVSVPAHFAPMFRVIAASTYLRTFASNRTHMYQPHQRRWSAPPPPYDMIQTDQDSHILPYLLHFSDSCKQTRKKKKAINAASAGDETWSRLDQQGALGIILTLNELQEHQFY